MCPRVNYGDGIAVVVGDVQEAFGAYREVLRCIIHCNEVDGFVGFVRYFQDLWVGSFQATSVAVDSPGSVGVMSMGRSSSLPLWNSAPARTRATRCGALTARQRVCAASMSL